MLSRGWRKSVAANCLSWNSMRAIRQSQRCVQLHMQLKSSQSVESEESPPGSLSAWQAVNEPLLEYLPGSEERKKVEASLRRLGGQITDVPIVIGDKEVRGNALFRFQSMPFEHKSKVAKFYCASPDIMQTAIDSAMDARSRWEATPLEERARIFLKAADLIAGKYRADVVAATMLGQGKTVYQAEIDAAAELADFLRFNVQFAFDVTRYQPISTKTAKNSMEYRALEGFVAAISPFNFTAIGGNLACAPALMGNVVVWKPSETAALSSYIVYKVLREAGLPPGVINFVPAEGKVFGQSITYSPHLAAINFTGSVPTFQWLWRKVGENLACFKNFPRVVGEVGGKNYHLVHESADIRHAVNNTIRSAFEYSGQKCSACSRLYVPDNIWPEFKQQLLEQHAQIKLGSPLEFDTFMSAVIDEKSYNRIKEYVDYAHASKTLHVIAGGKTDKSRGYFVEPTIVVSENPSDRLMKEEIFGPVLTVYVYKHAEPSQAEQLVDRTTPYALTGAIFAGEKEVLDIWKKRLLHTAGNFYINDKSTGAVVGQQPFGGARHSGTNDKAGSPAYLLRWTSPRSIKEGLTTLQDWRYPHMVR
ncbi:delta-1-pyrroline-5-carboxylate dehydrogenase, mitochondrial-like [Paramacrobiotus metropolitanus]|uniref:delta-1-pyrroline-5-carboxylate dehydrogenase, mitochondrial-like n=1 Tax=Paramacrobiotus metropolitanus TaxID=2943436 RepID=UPI002445CA94|nr:delta-1-pyrroline-5-carboxylate dehydrogenase, mitochondrial-like [Paramacrobiotus metropolitanus]